jgi:hypothetical protein
VDNLSRVKRDPWPRSDLFLPQRLGSGSHAGRKRDKIETSIVFIRCHKPQSLLNPLYGRTPLPRLRVKNADAELQEDADEVGFVADAFEEQLLETIAGFEVVAVVEEGDAEEEPRVVG